MFEREHANENFYFAATAYCNFIDSFYCLTDINIKQLMYVLNEVFSKALWLRKNDGIHGFKLKEKPAQGI